MDCLFGILGHTGVRIDGRLRTDWGTAKARGMLAVLLTRPGQWTSVDTLLRWMWAEDDDLPLNPASTFYNYANKIRDVLKRMAHPPVLSSRKGAYRIEVDRQAIDYFRSRELLDRSREIAARDSRGACKLTKQALELWADEPLADLPGDSAAKWREAVFEHTWMPAHNALCENYLAVGEPRAVLALLDEVQAQHPMNLLLVMRRLEALYALARGGDATSYFLGVYRSLQRDFDSDSAETLKRFHDQLFAQRGQQVETIAVTTTDLIVPRQLPHDVIDFSGREVLLAKLTATALVAERPRPCVVVLDGQGGVGKTALAVRWARGAAERFPDGQLYVDLGGFSDHPGVEPTAVVDRFLEGLGVPTERITEPERRAAKLQALLNDREVFVLLDNASDSDHVRPLLPLLSTCVVIVTSRRHLTGLASGYGCHCFHVEPMSDRQGGELLARRIGDRCQGEQVALAELVRLCGGLPIVLGLLAQHVIARPAAMLSEFVEQLHDDLRVLDLGSTGDGADHSVMAVFARSYCALRDDEQRLFRFLALHPGSDLNLDVAVALVGGERREVRRGMDVLVAANLLEQPGALDRFRLHDLLREYAADQLASAGAEEQAEAEARMLEFYLFTAKEADTRLFPFRPEVEVEPQRTTAVPQRFSDEQAAMRWCVRERGNITAMIRYAAAKGYHEFVCRLPQMVGEILDRYGYHEEVLANLRLALVSARAVGDVEGEADVLHNAGHVHLVRREFGLAEDCFHHAYEKFLKLGDEAGMAVSLHSSARLMVELGNVVMGIDGHARALRMIRTSGHRSLEVAFLCRMGEAQRRAFDFDQAAFYYRESLNLAVELGDLRAQGVCLVELGALSYDRGDRAGAKDYSRRMLAMAEQTHDVGTAGLACNLLSAISLDTGMVFEAKQYARKGAQLCRRVGDSHGEAIALDRLAEALKRSAQLGGAVEAWERAKAILADLDSPRVDEIERELALLALGVEVAPPAGRTNVALSAGRTNRTA